MKVVVDTERCTGHGRCYTLASDVFEPDEEGHSRTLVEEVPPNLEDQARMPKYRERFGDATSTIEVDTFSADEGHDYLTRSRGLPDDDRVKAIVARSDGVPFKLALFATIVQADPSLTDQAILDLEEIAVDWVRFGQNAVDRIATTQPDAVIECGYTTASDCTTAVGKGGMCFVDPDLARYFQRTKPATPLLAAKFTARPS